MRIPEYQGLKIGIEARGSIAKTKAYRVRRGNGHYGSILGQKYQDTMDYFVTNNPRTPNQQAWRAIHADAIAGAKALTEEQKTPYKEKATKEGGQTWLNIFVREYLLERA